MFRKNKGILFCRGQAFLLFFCLGFSTALAFSSGVVNPVSADPPSSSAKINKNYFSWNPFDMMISGRVVVGYEHLFQISDRVLGLYIQYSSKPNTVFKGILTGWNQGGSSGQSTRDMFEFPESAEFYVKYYVTHGLGKMKNYFQFGVSFIKTPEESQGATYIAFGPGGRTVFSKNFHVDMALSTLKIKIGGNPKYYWLQVNLFSFLIGFNI